MSTRQTLFPKVVAVQRQTSIEIGGLEAGRDYLVRSISKYKPQRIWERELAADAAGMLRWLDTFPVRGVYLLDVLAPRAERPAFTGHLIALPEDLARRIPLRCDFHLHTYYSDGRQSPTEMAVRGRELGLDALAITDHNRHAPSQEAISGVARLGLDLICLRGEEVSFPTWHMLSIAASSGVMARYESPEGQAEVAQLEEELGRTGLVDDLTAAEYAPVRWAVESIHRHGGRAFLAHPYWVASRAFHLDPRLYEQLVADGVLDGVELLGDVNFEDNLLSLARYQDLLCGGHKLPIIACSDAHGVEHTFGSHWSLVLAEEKTGESVLRAISDGYTAACSIAGPTGLREGFRAYGSAQMVEYALFLEQEFFPLHDTLCREEAAAAYAALFGQGAVENNAARCDGRMAQLYDRCLARRA